uniref:Uncharacterized protein n=1 Tax=Romanomermis culicivorax TaxID=13658 RepID=A0A915KIZ3_ROMCU
MGRALGARLAYMAPLRSALSLSLKGHLYSPFPMEQNAIDTTLPSEKEIFVPFGSRLLPAERFNFLVIRSVLSKKAISKPLG